MAARSAGLIEWQRRLATLVIVQRALGQCFGARAATWLARTAGLAFVPAALYTSALAPSAFDAVLRMTLMALSVCAALGALSAAGPAPDRILESARGLFEARAVPFESLRAARPFGVALWVLLQIGGVALIVVITGLALAREPHGLARDLGLALGTAGYLLALAAGLALLAELCHVLGRARGQALLIGFLVVPPLISPAWPALPTLVGGYRQLLDHCLGLEARS